MSATPSDQWRAATTDHCLAALATLDASVNGRPEDASTVAASMTSTDMLIGMSMVSQRLLALSAHVLGISQAEVIHAVRAGTLVDAAR